MPQALVVQTTRRATASAALSVPMVFVAWDILLALTVKPQWSPSWAGIGGFSVASWGIGATGALGLGLLRHEILRRALSLKWGRAFAGAFDGLLGWLFLVQWHNPASFQQTWRRGLALLVVVAVGAALGLFIRENWRRWFSGSAGLLAAIGMTQLSPNSDLFPRLALSGLLVVVLARLSVRSWLPRHLLVAAGAIALSLCGLSSVIFSHSEDARSLLAQRSIHARSWTKVVGKHLDLDNDGATNFFGESDCAPSRKDIFPGSTEKTDIQTDNNCSKGMGEIARRNSVVSSAHGKARGRDVLLLSIDSLRFDVTSELSKTRALLGDHARLVRAVSPSPGTVKSLSSTLRGRLFRQVQFKKIPGLRGTNPGIDPSPTIGEILSQGEYRSLTVPTHKYLRPETHVVRGFRALIPENTKRFVPAEDVAALLLPEVISSPRPVCAFVHYMDSHHPFRYGGKIGPDSMIGLKAAVRYVDAAIASLIGEVKEARGKLPVVVIFGDHGEEFQEHGGRFHATTAYAEQVRIPLLIAAPGVPDGDFAAPVSTAAVPATILDLLGLSIPESVTVESLLPYLTSEGDGPKIAVTEARSLRTVNGYTFESHRLLVDPVSSVTMLFDSRVDPLEQRDIARSQPKLHRQLLEKARLWDEAQ